ncbi:MAG TPA: protein kinase, partial [Bryobacterales bacterium]|nr:protein kinase [Bryobacterales bacterium]
LVEGETLQGPLPAEEAIAISRQICEALEAAHEKGVVHRDLKPANIKITPQGKVKLLDFGLAKAFAEDRTASDPAQSPTVSLATQAGVILGTAAYMSPEQARGRTIDRRTDIWAFGCVLYEMLSGRQAFGGDDATYIIAAVVRGDPDWSALPPSTPPQLRRLLERCLQKDPVQRLRDIGDVGLELEATPAEPAGLAASEPAPRSAIRERVAWGLAAVLLVAAVAAYFGRAPVPAPAQPVVKFTLLPPENTSFNEIAVSPDGRRVAFTARTASGATQLWVRALDSLSAQPLAGTEGAGLPFWSPDSRFLGFFAGEKLKKIEASGGPPQTLCNASFGRGGAWNRDGVIIFVPSGGAPLYRVPAAGGEPQPLTSLDPAHGEFSHGWPQFLPDGKHFLFLARGSQEYAGVYLASLDSKDRTRLVATASSAAYASGYLLFLRERTLVAQPFDLARLATTGEAVPVAEPVQSSGFSRARFSVSGTGVLVYDSGGSVNSSRLFWFDRAGKPLGPVGDPGEYTDVNLSPDDRRVTASRRDPQAGAVDIWLFELARGGVSSRFTFGPGGAAVPVWSPDGSRIAFFSSRDGPYNLYQKLANGAGSDEPLLKSSNNKLPMDWSRDGRYLLYREEDPKTKQDLWILPLEGGGKPFPFLRTASVESFGQFSPDGRWIAYASDESGKQEIYVRPSSGTEAGAGGKWLISSNGGGVPRWRRDGKELFYLAPDNKLMAVEVKAEAAALQPGMPQPLFQTRATGFTFRYAVTADGRRFLVISEGEQATSAPATVVLNWNTGLKLK